MNLDIFVLHGQFRGPRVEALSGYLSPFSSSAVVVVDMHVVVQSSGKPGRDCGVPPRH